MYVRLWPICHQEGAGKDAPDAEDKNGAGVGEGESAATQEGVTQSGTNEEQGQSPPSVPTDEEKAEGETQADEKAQEDAVGEETEHKEEPVPQTAVPSTEGTSTKGGNEQPDGGDEQLQQNEEAGDKEQPPNSIADKGVDNPESQITLRDEKTGAESTSELETHPPKGVDKLELQSSPREEKTAGESTSELEGHPPRTADKKKKKKPKSRGETGDNKPMPRLKRRSSRLESAGQKRWAIHHCTNNAAPYHICGTVNINICIDL